ncbi:MAG TPA: type II toxin-antitoxin system PemK/MazF family toxin [Candidatus Paceibacterota bacterium]
MNTNMRNEKKIVKTINRMSIYWVNFPKIEGSSLQHGIHPALILQNNKGNDHSPNVQVCTLTSQVRKCTLPTQVLITRDNINNLDKDSVIQLESTTNVPQFLVGDYIGKISNDMITKVERALKIQMGMKEIIKEVIKIVEVVKVEPFQMSYVEEKVFSVRKLKELYNITKQNDLWKMYQTALNDLKKYCKTYNKDSKVYFNDTIEETKNININEKIACAI